VTPEAPHPAEALLGLVYGELPPEAARAVQRHVDSCPACAETVADYQAVRRAAAVLPRAVETPAGLESLLHYGAQAATRRRRWRRLAWVWPLATAGVAVWVAVVAVRPPVAPEVASAPVAEPPASAPVAGVGRDEAKAGPWVAAGEVGRGAKPTPPVQAPSAPLGVPAAVQVAKRENTREAAKKEDALARADASPARLGANAPLEKPLAAEARAKATLPAAPVASVQAVGHLEAQANSGAAAGAQAAAPALAEAPARMAMASAKGRALLDAGPADEARRQVLLAQLSAARGAEALPLLAELCALDARLGLRDEASAVCGRVVHESPGTPEAAAAERQLEGLRRP
jgi:hypothetical protein